MFAEEIVIDGRKTSIGPAQIRFITPTSATSTCIDELREPLCAIETAVACNNQVWRPSCAVLRDIPYDTFVGRRVEYVILKSGFVNENRVPKAEGRGDYSEADIPDHIEDPDYFDVGWFTSNTFQARVLERVCGSVVATCDGNSWNDEIYSVNSQNGLWALSWKESFDQSHWFVD
ncbi:MAG: hypothetical protein WCF16_06240 [Alphaproteobacteria bacterium]